jgi:hypothetical protein
MIVKSRNRPSHPVQLPVQKLGISRYLRFRTLPAGRPTAQLVNLFFHERLAEGFYGHTTVLVAQLTNKKWPESKANEGFRENRIKQFKFYAKRELSCAVATRRVMCV